MRNVSYQSHILFLGKSNKNPIKNKFMKKTAELLTSQRIENHNIIRINNTFFLTVVWYSRRFFS